MIDENKLTYLPMTVAIEPPEGVINHIMEKYWVFHVKKGVVFLNSIPQCSHSEEKAERLLDNYDRGQYYIQFMPSVFQPMVKTEPEVKPAKKTPTKK